jgi:hypothetical protein
MRTAAAVTPVTGRAPAAAELMDYPGRPGYLQQRRAAGREGQP